MWTIRAWLHSGVVISCRTGHADDANLISRLMSAEGLKDAEAVLVEDDPAEISSVKGVCRSVFVSERKGMMATELQELRAMAKASTTDSASAAAKASGVPVAKVAGASQAAPGGARLLRR